jgi:UPF0716 protein FxsA
VLGRLFLLFTLVPLVELYLLVSIGSWMGVAPTIALVAVTGILGAWLAKREGRKALIGYRDALTQGRLPEDGIVSGLLILVGGALLIAPGVLTDLTGLALMIPPIRRGVAKLVTRRVESRINSGELSAMYLVSGGAPSGAGFGMPGNHRQYDARDDVVGEHDGRERAPGVVDVEVVENDARGL